MGDVYGKNTLPPAPVEASEIADLIDFLYVLVFSRKWFDFLLLLLSK